MASSVPFHLSVPSIVTAIVVVAGLMPPTALAQGHTDPVMPHVEPLDAARVRAYWTPERLRSARPMRLPTLQKSAPETQRTEPQAPPAIAAPPYRPGDAAGQEPPGPALEGEIEPLAGTYPFSYTRFRLFPDNGLLGRLQIVYKQFPYNLAGKLFATIPGRGNIVCSGASINSTNRSVVWTTGHCVYTPGVGFHTNFLFAPARRAGADPYGTWTAKTAITTSGWANNALPEFDLGALVMNLGGAGNLTIGETIGGLGFLYNAARQQHWHIPGYPAVPRNPNLTPPGAQFDGEHQEICAANWATDDQPSGNAAIPQAIGVGCDQTDGVSGAPFIVNYSGVADQNNFLNGQATYRYSGPNPPENLKLFSPYFGDAAITLFNAAQVVPVP